METTTDGWKLHSSDEDNNDDEVLETAISVLDDLSINGAAVDGIARNVLLSTSYTPPEIGDKEMLVNLEEENCVEKNIFEFSAQGENSSDQNTSEDLQYNTRALSKHDKTYKLETFDKNMLIIFNQVNVKGYSESRLGTEMDVESLKKTFTIFGFEVETHTDFKKHEIFDELEIFSTRDFTDYGCIAIAILTHGSNDGLLMAADDYYTETDVISFFRSQQKPTLFTKPILVMIQACRGTSSVKGVPVFEPVKIMKDVHREIAEPYSLPVEADMLIVHSSYIGKPSHRTVEGSWFIQSLCRKVDLMAMTNDLETIITEVCHEVAVERYHVEYNRVTRTNDTNKQMPTKTSTLIRKLYLKKFGDDSSDRNKGTSVSTMPADEVFAPSVDYEDSGIPDTPSSEPCHCFLKNFDYIRNCLRHLLDEIPEDTRAEELLALADTYQNLEVFNEAKRKMLPLMCAYLKENAVKFDFFKFLNLNVYSK